MAIPDANRGGDAPVPPGHPGGWLAVDIPLATNRRFQLVDITTKVRRAVADSGVRQGFVLVCTPHTTSAIRINEDDARLHEDMENLLCGLAVQRGPYRHDLRTVDDRPNAWGHLMALLMGASEILPVRDGEIELGNWQAVFFVELDGPRRERKAVVRVLGV
jgi:secondary thiamine-phosphate synthase enzyme